MNIEDVNFDNFLSLPLIEQQQILNDFSLLKQLVKKNISEHRYVHSLSVADVCKHLASFHNVDENKAYLTGLLHDACKFKDDKKYLLSEYLEKYDKDKLKLPSGTYHSFVAKYYLKEKLNFNDEEVLNAIYNHTILNSNDKLSLIVYIADKREPTRGINDDVLKIAESDLNKAYEILKKDVEEYIKSKNERLVKNNI